MEGKDSIRWPRKHNIFGVGLSETTYDELLEVERELERLYRMKNNPL